MLREIADFGYRIVMEATTGSAVQIAENRAMFEAIRQRAQALSLRFPEHKALFDAYCAVQEEEFGVLEKEVENVTLLLKRI